VHEREVQSVTQGSAAVNRPSEWNVTVRNHYCDSIIVTVTITRTKEQFTNLQQDWGEC